MGGGGDGRCIVATDQNAPSTICFFSVKKLDGDERWFGVGGPTDSDRPKSDSSRHSEPANQIWFTKTDEKMRVRTDRPSRMS
jgi:hypothetical protein